MHRSSRTRPAAGPRPSLAGTMLAAVWSPFLSLPGPGAAGRVTGIATFGSNPGGLRMLVYTPPRPPAPGAPLVVVLHGCGQRAESFAADAGWIALAAELNLPLLLPEQSARNNAGHCFNWYHQADARRGGGEALSIRQMVRAAIRHFGSDPRRVYVAGFSAGAAMTTTLLATYPAVFAAGAAVAGVPVGCAVGGAHALFRMRHPDAFRSRQSWASAVRAATLARPTKPWPRLSIWQGGRDRTVDPANAEALAAQWSELHGWGPEPAVAEDRGPGLRRYAWGLPARPAVELWALDGLGHGFPVDRRRPGCGREGAWVADAGLPAARHIAAFWGLAPAPG
ncbi:PHB depolymerase family esterase [Roseomonas sp. NAR14]|uniref:PHB depolymerase family esterase n=1 Tax=Roseomonas acroporae TaxID=2937791 RepID=A0A9X2BUT3_9PROT|nr:PHB depolymerase family esterase [Roseomonas acroporae]MCK8785877.1 PHB depolymerase family esterase [Roseomonas acroporae]